jgi:hypothetical protein
MRLNPSLALLPRLTRFAERVRKSNGTYIWKKVPWLLLELFNVLRLTFHLHLQPPIVHPSLNTTQVAMLI